MTDKDQASREDYDRTLPVPSSVAVTFGIDRWYWSNQEDGQRTGPHWMPSLDDVEGVVNWRQLMMGQEP
jgi:hypothetical protein